MTVVKPETLFGNKLRSKLPANIYALKMRLTLATGIPDWWYSGTASDLWLELKWMPVLPKTFYPNCLLSAHQQRWLYNRFWEGRNVGLLIGTNIGSLFFPGVSCTSQWTRSSDIKLLPIVPTILNLARKLNGPETSSADCRFTRTDFENAMSFVEHLDTALPVRSDSSETE